MRICGLSWVTAYMLREKIETLLNLISVFKKWLPLQNADSQAISKSYDYSPCSFIFFFIDVYVVDTHFNCCVKSISQKTRYGDTILHPSLAHSIVRSLAHSFINSLAPSLPHKLGLSFVRSFVRSLARSFIRSFIHSFSVCVENHAMGK